MKTRREYNASPSKKDRGCRETKKKTISTGQRAHHRIEYEREEEGKRCIGNVMHRSIRAFEHSSIEESERKRERKTLSVIRRKKEKKYTILADSRERRKLWKSERREGRISKRREMRKREKKPYNTQKRSNKEVIEGTKNGKRK